MFRNISIRIYKLSVIYLNFVKHTVHNDTIDLITLYPDLFMIRHLTYNILTIILDYLIDVIEYDGVEFEDMITENEEENYDEIPRSSEDINLIFPSEKVIQVFDCPVCFNNITTYQRRLKCGHLYCLSCIDRWLSVNEECCLCRRHVSFPDQLFYQNTNTLVDQ